MRVSEWYQVMPSIPRVQNIHTALEPSRSRLQQCINRQ